MVNVISYEIVWYFAWHIVNIVNYFGRGTSKLSELVPNPFEYMYINEICSKQKTELSDFESCSWKRRFGMWTLFKSFLPDLKYVFRKTDEIRWYFYNHSHGADRSVLGYLLLYLIQNNGTVLSSCRKKTLPGIYSISLVKFHAVF
jgi:hypothetical protein